MPGQMHHGNGKPSNAVQPVHSDPNKLARETVSTANVFYRAAVTKFCERQQGRLAWACREPLWTARDPPKETKLPFAKIHMDVSRIPELQNTLAQLTSLVDSWEPLSSCVNHCHQWILALGPHQVCQSSNSWLPLRKATYSVFQLYWWPGWVSQQMITSSPKKDMVWMHFHQQFSKHEALEF